MNLVCDLKEFFIRDLQVCGVNKIDSPSVAMSYGFDYDLFCHNKDCHQIRMVLRVIVGPDKASETRTCPYEIKATIEGFFSFSENLDDKEMAYLVRVNSATILYGILRGEIASVTGSFPAGKFIMPTVMMQDVVKDIEMRKSSSSTNAPGCSDGDPGSGASVK